MNNLKIVTQIEEVLADIGDPNCKMIEPYVVGEQDTLSPWLVDCTNQNEFMISSDKILEMYQTQVLNDGKEETNQTTSSDEQSEDSNAD